MPVARCLPPARHGDGLHPMGVGPSPAACPTPSRARCLGVFPQAGAGGQVSGGGDILTDDLGEDACAGPDAGPGHGGQDRGKRVLGDQLFDLVSDLVALLAQRGELGGQAGSTIPAALHVRELPPQVRGQPSDHPGRPRLGLLPGQDQLSDPPVEGQDLRASRPGKPQPGRPHVRGDPGQQVAVLVGHDLVTHRPPPRHTTERADAPPGRFPGWVRALGETVQPVGTNSDHAWAGAPACRSWVGRPRRLVDDVAWPGRPPIAVITEPSPSP